MVAAAKLDGLRARERWFTHAALICLGLAFIAAVLVLVHIETGAGAHIRDVHVPIDWLRARPGTTLAFGEPYDVGLGWGKVVQWLTVLSIAALAIGGLWLTQNKSVPQKWRNAAALVLVILGMLFLPVPKLLVMGTAKAVSMETAERLIRTPPDTRVIMRPGERAERQAISYMQAQIAYVRGDRLSARAFSAGVDPEMMNSPIEGPYRLQFLQDRYLGLTTVCFIRTGCLDETERDFRFTVSLILMLLMLLLAALFAIIAQMLRGRLKRIDHMVAARLTRISPATPG